MSGSSSIVVAYGSNLDPGDLDRWCAAGGHAMPRWSWIGPGFVADHAPAFDRRSARWKGGALTIVPRRGAIAPCGLFETDETGVAVLDVKEGAPRWYERVEVVVLDDALGARRATAYRVPDAARVATPAALDYVETVRRGTLARGMDPAWIDRAVACAVDPCPVGVFVYGTLLRGECRGHVLERFGTVTVEPATVRGVLVDCGAYPGLAPGDGLVHGELVTLRAERMPEAVAALDDIEGFAGFATSGRLDARNLYHRRLVRATVPGGPAPRLAFAYLLAAPEGRPTIASGNWRRRASGA